MKTYMVLRRREFALTCLGRNLCCHEIGRLHIIMGSAMRLEGPLFCSHVPLDSSHIRIHYLKQHMTNRQSPASDRTGERYNQKIMRVNARFKRTGDHVTRLRGIMNAFIIAAIAKPVEPKYRHKKKRVLQTPQTKKNKKKVKICTLANTSISVKSPITKTAVEKPDFHKQGH